MRWILPIVALAIALPVSGCGPDSAVPSASCWRSDSTFTLEQCQAFGAAAGCAKSETSEDGGCKFKNCDEKPDCG